MASKTPRKRAPTKRADRTATRATDAIKEARVTQVVELLVMGLGPGEIKSFAEQEGWGIKSRQMDTYIQRANAVLKELEEADRKVETEKAKARLNHLYMRALRVQDFKTALSVQKEINALHGLNAPTKVAPTNPEGDEPYINPLELLKAKLDRLGR